jgi:hypothetical protein
MLMAYDVPPVANGARTDHPVPDLPFVDDGHIPVEDPLGIEAIGRHPGTGTWGREDPARDGGWVAFTTDPGRHDLAWCVRWHPVHGRSVLLVRDEDAASMHSLLGASALLFRAGGYWWDGEAWYRPAQVWDVAGEQFYRRPVPAAVSVTAADLLEGDGDPRKGVVLDIADVGPGRPPAGRWLDDLALWAAGRPADKPLSASVVSLSAPELSGDQLVGAAELARIGGVAASTLRAYIARGESAVPPPQATISGRSAWARPVAQEWAEQRRRSADGLTTAVGEAGRAGPGTMAPGVAEVWRRYAGAFFSALWDNPAHRKRWAIRWRTPAAVREVADDLGWQVAAGLGGLVPAEDLSITIQHAVLDEFAEGQRLDQATSGEAVFYGITPSVTRMLDWLIRHHPASAGPALGHIVGEADRRFGISRRISEESLRTALALDSKLDADRRQEFLDRALAPQPEEESR